MRAVCMGVRKWGESGWFWQSDKHRNKTHICQRHHRESHCCFGRQQHIRAMYFFFYLRARPCPLGKWACIVRRAVDARQRAHTCAYPRKLGWSFVCLARRAAWWGFVFFFFFFIVYGPAQGAFHHFCFLFFFFFCFAFVGRKRDEERKKKKNKHYDAPLPACRRENKTRTCAASWCGLRAGRTDGNGGMVRKQGRRHGNRGRRVDALARARAGTGREGRERKQRGGLHAPMGVAACTSGVSGRPSHVASSAA